MKKIIISLVALLVISFNLSAQQKPNIIIILADDLDAIVTPHFFSEVLPVVDSLKKNGIDFENSFTPMSICCPSRSALLSGKYGHETEVLRNGGEKGGWDDFIDDEPQALPAHLSKAGYRTAMIGKYMNGYETNKGEMPPLPYGWTDGAVFVDPLMGTYKGYNYNLMTWNDGVKMNDSVWHSENKKLEKYGKLPEDYSTDVLTAKAVRYIKNTELNDAQPFFLYLTPTPPHFPLPPAFRYEEKTKQRWLQDTILAQPNTFNDFGKLATEKEKKKPLDKSSWLRDTWKKRVRQQNRGDFHYGLMYEGKIPRSLKSFRQADWFYRMGSLYALNDMVREVIATLKANGEWENTLLIFTSDNGFQFGYHALYHKGSPYEESIRVPLVITGGASLNLKTSTQIEDWIINLDLMPTILDVAGIPIPDDVDGKSFKPFIEFNNNQPKTSRDQFIMEYIGPGMTTDFIAKHPKLIFKIMPSYVLDHPTFKAIRMKVEVEKNGMKQEQVFKYIEWEKYHGDFKFRKKLENKDPKLLARIATGNKKALKKKAKAEAIETELYNITEDPYEMDNLLYYLPDAHISIAEKLREKLYKELRK
ncbi:MAG: sulfatase-like hydrolase/transferase [Chitinophagales bacterium]|nr:sulfatase-like hydrolase/transferase [Chitinophagales bacterium]